MSKDNIEKRNPTVHDTVNCGVQQLAAKSFIPRNYWHDKLFTPLSAVNLHFHLSRPKDEIPSRLKKDNIKNINWISIITY